MKTKIIVLSDIHYAVKARCLERRGNIGDILLLRAVHRINRYLKPDLVCLLGDFDDVANIVRLREIRGIINLLESPHVVIPGNHDGPPERFFEIFKKPLDHMDIGCCRFIPFVDPEEPGYNASRTKKEIKRMSALASDWNGPVASLQHVPLCHTGAYPPYNYTNADEITEAMRKSGVTHTISGHYHAGFHLPDDNGLSVIVAPALCEKPFRFLDVTIESNGKTSVTELSLALDESLELSDFHIHSKFAYCNENMDFQKVLELRDDFNLKSTCFSEHTAHLYMNRSEYGDFIKTGATNTQSEPRTSQFLKEAGEYRSERALVGFEVDCDFSGNPLLQQEDREQADLIIGALHYLPPEAQSDVESAKIAFQRIMETFVQSPMDILAHPFRIFRRSGLPTPEELYPFVANLLKSNDIAAELNFHTNEPPPKFVEICLNEGVKLSLGSDSHNLYEVGEFYPHLKLLESLGGADLKNTDILYKSNIQ